MPAGKTKPWISDQADRAKTASKLGVQTGGRNGAAASLSLLLTRPAYFFMLPTTTTKEAGCV